MYYVYLNLIECSLLIHFRESSEESSPIFVTQKDVKMSVDGRSKAKLYIQPNHETKKVTPVRHLFVKSTSTCLFRYLQSLIKEFLLLTLNLMQTKLKKGKKEQIISRTFALE